MNTREIEVLLSKYNDGETSAEEEQSLKDFFSTGDIPPELEGYRRLFLYYSTAADENLEDEGFEEKIYDRIIEDRSPIPMHTNRRKIYYLSAVAASVLLLISMVFLFVREKQTRVIMDVSYSSQQQQLYTQAHDILALVSVNLNKGIDKMEYIGKFDEAIRKMEMLSKYYEYQSIIINQDRFERSNKNK